MDPERIELTGDTDLRDAVERVRADGAPRLIEHDGQTIAVLVSPEDFAARNLPKSRRFKDQIMSLAGAWDDVDVDSLLEHIQASHEESLPSPPPGA